MEKGTPMGKLIAFLSSIFLTGCTLMGIRTSEEAPYAIVSDFGEIQIRLYSPIVVAETEVAADYAASGGIGFNRLAAYIFGNNSQKEKMTMTTPVFRENAGEKIDMAAPELQQQVGDKWIMSFVMPSGYNLTSLPPPPWMTRLSLKKLGQKRLLCFVIQEV